MRTFSAQQKEFRNVPRNRERLSLVSKSRLFCSVPIEPQENRKVTALIPGWRESLDHPIWSCWLCQMGGLL